MPTDAIRVNGGKIYDDRLRSSLHVLDFHIEQITVIYPECVMAFFERAAVKISVVDCLNGLDKRPVIPRAARPLRSRSTYEFHA
jgi:hypothetical protein